MRYFDRLLNFFSSNYLNNTRFHHSTLGYLKIFFERNNKLKSTFSSLGNVFRNSKWSDLKVQNIKTSFIKSWSNYFLTILAVLFLVFPFFGTYYGNTLTYYIPFLGEAYELFSFLWTHVEDAIKAFIIFLFSTWSYIKSLFVGNLAKKQNHIYSSLTLQNNKPAAVLQQSSIKLSDNGIKNHAPIEMMYCLAHTTKNLGNLKSSPSLSNHFAKMHFDSWNVDDCLDNDFFPMSTSDKLLSITDLEYTYTVTPKQVFAIHQLDIESSNLNKITSYNIALSLTGLNTQEALKASKEDRWLLRNSLLSENLILNSNSFTQSKKLLGVNFLSSDVSSKNVWASTKLNNSGAEGTANFLANIQELFLNQSPVANKLNHLPSMSNNMTNFEFFENSRMWLTKKYFFTNQLKNNTFNLSTINHVGNTNQVVTNNQVFSVLLNSYSQSISTQLTYLIINTPNNNSVLPVYKNLPHFDVHVGAGDLDLLKLNNLSFINKLTYSSSVSNLNYYTTLPNNSFTLSNHSLKFKK